MAIEIEREELKGRPQLEDQQEIEIDGETFTLNKITSMTMNERHVTVFREDNEDRAESLEPPSYTVEVYDIDEITELCHQMDGEEVMHMLANLAEEGFNG